VTEEPRKLRADAQRNRDRVLAVADEMFSAEGLATPIDEVARRAEVGVGTVYRHFPTKEALFEAVMRGRLEWLIGQARAGATAADPVAALFDFLTVLTDNSGANHGLHDALRGAGVDVRIYLAELAPALMEALGALLRRAQAAGGVRADVGEYELKALSTGLCTIAEPGVRSDLLRRIVYDGLRATPG
jgi:AcrR family transcriptional regulator